MDATREMWRRIPGHPDYEASDLGRIRSWRRSKTTPRVLRPAPVAHGYLMVNLPAGNRYVHRLVLAAFVGPCPEGMEVAHNDGSKANNRPDNLRYATKAENQADRIRHGTDDRGARSARAKLTEEQVSAIRALHAAGQHTQRSLSAMFGVGKNQIAKIVRRESWVTVP